MTLEHQRSPPVPLACSLWLAGHRENSSLGVLSRIPAEAKGLATTEPYCQNIVLSTYLGISGPVALGFLLCLLPLHYPVFFLILSSLNPISVCYYSIIPLSFLLLLLVSHYSCFTSIPIFDSANCSFISVLLCLLQILYLIILPFIRGLLTQSSFFLHCVHHHSVHNSDSMSAAPPCNWHFAIQNICKDIKQRKEMSPNDWATPRKITVFSHG